MALVHVFRQAIRSSLAPAGALLCVAVLGCEPGDRGPKEPRYKGHPLSHWVGLLADDRERNRRMAFGSLVSMGEDAHGAVPALTDYLTHSDLEIRDSAVRVLAILGEAAAPARGALERNAAVLDSLLQRAGGMDRASQERRDRYREMHLNVRFALEKLPEPEPEPEPGAEPAAAPVTSAGG